LQVLSINVGLPRPVAHHGELVHTAIFKQPTAGPVRATKLGLAGDGQADLANHGGEYKAVYAYQHEMYSHWQRQLNRDDFQLGQFGENLTVTGLPDDDVCIGDLFQIGDAQLQVTQPRAPCFKLGIRMNDATFVKRFFQSCHVGFYLRVLREGDITAGDAVVRIDRAAEKFTIERTFQLMLIEKHSRTNFDEIRRLVTVAGFAPAWRDPLVARLAEPLPP
jgi:MOSC domain-containing protein YiiM